MKPPRELDLDRLLPALERFTRRLGQQKPLDDLMWAVAEGVQEHFEFPDCVVYLVEDGHLVQAAAQGVKHAGGRTIVEPITIEWGHGITGTCAAEARAVRVDDVSADPRYIFDVFSGRSELAVPILYGDRVLGVIDSEAAESSFYSERDELLLTMVANIVAPHIASAAAQKKQHDTAHRLRVFHDLIDQSDDTIFVIDPVSGHFLEVNDAVEQQLGYSRQELSRMTPADLSPEGEPSFWRDLIEPLRERGTLKFDAEHRCKDGSTIPVEVNLGLPTVDGREYLLGVARDVRDRRRYEEALLKARDAAQAASQAKSEFLANVSHEIRTPMTGVIGMTDLLAASDLTPRQKGYTRVLKQSARRLLALVDDLLDLGRIEAGEVTLQPRPFELRSLVREVLAELETEAQDRGLTLRAPSIPEAILVSDPLRLRQILSNLVANGAKFTKEGHVAVEAEVSESASGVRLRVCVRDTGVGIPPEKLETVFERFTQADTSTTRRYGGAGLGLTISRELVELLGGSIEVESKVGEGSCFRFEVPVERPGTRDPSTPLPAASESLDGLRVLVVEDDPAVRLVTARVLEDLGVVVDAAAHGVAALEAVARERYSLILMDCQMPEMDGYEAAEAIRGLAGPVAATPIIALTAHVLRGERERCFKAGMDDYLTKPATSETLRETLVRWGRRRSPQGLTTGRRRPPIPESDPT